MIPSQMEERIREMGIKEAYNFLVSEEDVPKNIMKRARYGWLMPSVDIWDYLRENSGITLRKKTGKARYRGKTYTMGDIYTDMEKRLRLIKKYLLETYVGKGDDYAKPR